MSSKNLPDARVDLGHELFMEFRESLIEGVEASEFSSKDDIWVVYASFLSSLAGQMVVKVDVVHAQMAFDLAKKATTGAARLSLRSVLP